MIHNVLSIAGSDPSGGAGIQADLKAFAARGTYGMAALTALTAQNTQGVVGVHPVPPEFVRKQIEAVFDDIRVDAVKVGMIASAEIAYVIAEVLARHSDVPVVLDPVMIAKGGASLLDPSAITALTDRLLPRATLITPNLPEAAALLNGSIATNRAEMEAQAQQLREIGGGAAVLLKGGHLGGDDSPDVLATGDGVIWLDGSRVQTANTHGTGCTLSSALAAELAKGKSLPEAARSAKAYLADAIGTAEQLTVGSGHGPVNHFHRFLQANP